MPARMLVIDMYLELNEINVKEVDSVRVLTGFPTCWGVNTLME